MYYNRIEKRRKYVKNENGVIHQYARNFFIVIILEGDQVRICNKSSYTTFLTPAKRNKHIF